MEEILMLKNVSVFYGEHPVLKDVNMGIRPGRILAVMGPSGSGKTTLLRALNGLLWEEPEAEMKGEICLLGRDTRTMDREELRRRVGLVFQTPQPFPFSIYKRSSIFRWQTAIQRGRTGHSSPQSWPTTRPRLPCPVPLPAHS